MGDLRGWRSFGDKGELEVVNDLLHHGIVSEESDDLHVAATLGADHGVNFEDLADLLGPALGGRTSRLLLPLERQRPSACPPEPPSMGISVEAIIADSDPTLIRDMIGHAGDELQVVYPLGLLSLFPILVENLYLFL